ncbi:hypothetical protein [Streptomyces endophyticus]|uniref:DUF3558 domain-containing protein n=1 Tax=Streptomyces endophyticus TaxID=714166 RepID=A0ABU6FJ90_9ACTN|nr:hypothetical protein [Streptomyces endophyticus]MEB8342867.1 hypothetical protein [Streptomyces endophyticus]
MAVAAAAVLLLGGCGSGSGSGSEPAAKPVDTLQARQAKTALPDKSSLPGWTQVGARRVDTDVYMCQVVAGDACKGVVATGTANFVRGPKRTDKWLRYSFNVYSCRTEDHARRMYEALPDYAARPGSKKISSLGDESAASSDVLKGEHPLVSFHDKVRVGRTVIWTYAMGTEKAVTGERAEMAAKLQADRVQQAHRGLKPTAHVDVP